MLTIAYGNTKLNTNSDYTRFERLYDKHAPKIFGFITLHTPDKEHAEEVMENVFLKVWDDIKNFDEDADKKILRILLSIYKPVYKKFIPS